MPDIAPVGFEEFYEKEFRALVGFARRHGAGHEAEDTVQTAFGYLFIAWPTVDEPAAWIRTVIGCQVKRVLGRRRTRPLDGFERRAEADRAEPDERDRVLALLRRLPWEERTVLAWELDGYTIDETAKFTGTDPAEVRNARRRARTKLARLMREH